ncbi:hypothetical protein [Paenibacillus agilis]|uniref:Uncharacterized protein n=1 Tax=Paenibacillus agilis TaxID=3020863 RepID=A0A559J0I4_9BACL|nr:hypothetical protein [Paenibacillus agilis]TVX93399.1 hypothetical protein FPZ44_10240 [Paenibacillus agilis]
MKSMLTLKPRKPLILFVVFLLCTTVMIPLTASAAYFNTYTTVATLENANGGNSAQGFDVGSTYAYSVKVSNGDQKQVIYRTNMNTGATELMKNGDNGTTYRTDLGHANDIVLSTIDGTHYMFVATMKDSSAGVMSLVKLKYVGATYYKVGSYTIKRGGANESVSGVKILSKDANNINFLFKKGVNFYKGTLPLTANSGTINISPAFSINVQGSLVNGSPIPDITYTHQSFAIYKNTIFVPITNKNVSIVLVYRNVSTASGTITSDPNLSFRITSAAYPELFEIEGVGVAHGDKLWFNTNRKKTTTDLLHDGVHYFNDFNASQFIQ